MVLILHTLSVVLIIYFINKHNCFFPISFELCTLTYLYTYLGAFRHASLPTGIKTSPESLRRFMDKILQYEVVFDDKDKPLKDEELVRLKYAPIPEVQCIYDDFIISTPLAETKVSVLYFFF